MAELAFISDDKLFDGECVRFTGQDGAEEVLCGVTTAALLARDQSLPRHGLLPAEAFLAAFDRFMTEIHAAARDKHKRGAVETNHAVRILVHRADLCS
jgi:hypothetical protein